MVFCASRTFDSNYERVIFSGSWPSWRNVWLLVAYNAYVSRRCAYPREVQRKNQRQFEIV